MILFPREVANTIVLLLSDALNAKGINPNAMDELTDLEKIWMNNIKATTRKPNIHRKPTLQQQKIS